MLPQRNLTTNHPMTTGYAYLLVLTFCLGVALSQREYLDGNFRWLFWLVIVTWIVDVAGTLLRNTINNHPLYHAFQPVEYGLYAMYFFHTLRQPLVRKIIPVSIVLMGVFSVVNALFFQSIWSQNSYSFMLEAALLLVWSVIYFFELYTNFTPQNLRELPEFWVSTGVLFFYAGSFFQMGLHRYLMRVDEPWARQLWVINLLLNILLYSLITVGFLCKTAQKKSYLSSS